MGDAVGEDPGLSGSGPGHDEERPGAVLDGLTLDRVQALEVGPYSHSIVPGGFEVMSNATRLTPGTSLMMRLESRSSSS